MAMKKTVCALMFFVFALSVSSFDPDDYRYSFSTYADQYDGTANINGRINEPILFHMPDECWSDVNMTEGEFIDLVIMYRNTTEVRYWYDSKSLNTVYGNQTGGLYARLNVSVGCDMCMLNYTIYCNPDITYSRPSSLVKEFYFYDDFEDSNDWSQGTVGTDPKWDTDPDARGGYLQNIYLPLSSRTTNDFSARHRYLLEWGRTTSESDTTPNIQLYDSYGSPCSFTDDNGTCMNITNDLRLHMYINSPDKVSDNNMSFAIDVFGKPKITVTESLYPVYQVLSTGIYDRKCGDKASQAYDWMGGYGTLYYDDYASIYYPFLYDSNISCSGIVTYDGGISMEGSYIWDRGTHENTGQPYSSDHQWVDFDIRISPNQTARILNTEYQTAITDIDGIILAVGFPQTYDNNYNKVIRVDDVWAFPNSVPVIFYPNATNVYVSIASENPDYRSYSPPRIYRANGYNYSKIITDYDNASQMDMTKPDSTLITISDNLTDLHWIYNYTDIEDDGLKSVLVQVYYNGTLRSNLTQNLTGTEGYSYSNNYLDNFDNITNWQNITGLWRNEDGYLKVNVSGGTPVYSKYNLSRNFTFSNTTYRLKFRLTNLPSADYMTSVGITFNSSRDIGSNTCALFFASKDTGTGSSNGFFQYSDGSIYISSKNITTVNNTWYYIQFITNDTSIDQVYFSDDPYFNDGERVNLTAPVSSQCKQDLVVYSLTWHGRSVEVDYINISRSLINIEAVPVTSMFNLSHEEFKNHFQVQIVGTFCDQYNCSTAPSQLVSILPSGFGDITPPVITSYSPSSITYYNRSTILINFTATDNIAVHKLAYIDYSGMYLYTTPLYIPILNGSQIITLFANDTSGNFVYKIINLNNVVNSSNPIPTDLPQINCVYPCIFKDDFSYVNYIDRNCWYGSIWRYSDGVRLPLDSYAYLYHDADMDDYQSCGATQNKGNVIDPFSLEFDLNPTKMLTTNKYGITAGMKGNNDMSAFEIGIKNLTNGAYLVEVFRGGISSHNNFENSNIGLLNVTTGTHRYKFTINTNANTFDFYVDNINYLSSATFYQGAVKPYGTLFISPSGNIAYLDNVLMVYGSETNETYYSNYTSSNPVNTNRTILFDWSSFTDEDDNIIQCYFKSFVPITRSFADGSSYTVGGTALGSYFFNYSCCDYYPQSYSTGEKGYKPLPHDTMCFNKVMFKGAMTTFETWFFDNYIWALLIILLIMIALPFYVKSRKG